MPIIYLTGMRASGKTTVGLALAQSLNCPFADLDHYLVQKTSSTIEDIVSQQGWEKFRELESEILQEISKSYFGTNAVISTGGGVILAEANRQHLVANGHVVWLKASPELIHERLCKNPLHAQRPALTTLQPLDEIRQTLAQREPLYASCCHQQIEAKKSPQEICRCIISFLESCKALH